MGESLKAYHLTDSENTFVHSIICQRPDKRDDLCRLRTLGEKLQAVQLRHDSQKGACNKMAAELNALYGEVSPRKHLSAADHLA